MLVRVLLSVLLGFPFVAANGSVMKPIFMHLEGQLGGARLVAEADVVSVEAAGWMGEEGLSGAATIRVTSDPARVFVGHQYLGRTLDVRPTPSGPAACTGELARHRDAGRRILVVFGPTDETIVAIGVPVEEDRYEIHGFCDYNACLLSYRPLGLSTRERLMLPRREIVLATSWSRNAQMARVARLRSGEPVRLGEPELLDLVARLGSSSEVERRAAHDALVADAFLSIDVLVAAFEREPEGVRRERFALVMTELDDWLAASAAADVVDRLDRDAAFRLVREAHIGALDPAARALAGRYVDGLGDR